MAHSGVKFDDKVLEELIRNMGNVSGVLHVVPADFVRRVRFVPEDADDYADDNSVRNWTQVRIANDSSPVDVYIDYDKAHIFLRIVNMCPSSIGEFAFAVNKNILGLTVKETPAFPESLGFGESAEISVPIAFDPSVAGADTKELQLALRTSVGTVYGHARCPVEYVTTEAGKITQDEFRTSFAAFTATATTNVTAARVASEESLKERHVYVVGRNGPKTYVSLALFNGDKFLVELGQSPVGIGVSIKGSSDSLLPLIVESAPYLFAEV